MNRKHALLALIGCLISAPILAQNTIPLNVGTSIAGTLAADSKDVYAIYLETDWFVFGTVDQLSVDVAIKVYAPDNSTILTVNGPDVGLEYFRFDTKEAGTYRIEVSPFEGAFGSYSMFLRNAEPFATDPESRIDQLLARYDTETSPGVVVAIIEGDEITFQKAYGLANLSHQIPFTVETRTNIGSTSKQFTAMGILLLANRGKLALDDDIRKHIPELPDLGHVVTIRNLLTHTSGYREFLNELLMAGRILFEGDYIAREEVIEIVQRQPELQNLPGAEWNYNNTAFALLAVVIERISGQDFPEWMAENVFEPLGMKNTRIRAHVGEIIPNSAQGYVPYDGGIREAADISASMGAGGIYTTVGDLAKWVQNYHTATLGGRSAIDAMTTRFVLSSGDTTNYGLGLMIDEDRGLKRYHHGGADTAHRSTFVYYPELEAGYTIQSNFGAFNGGVATEISELFFGDFMTTESESDLESETIEFDPESFDPEVFDDFAGRFELDVVPGFILTFSRDGGDFFIQATGQPQVPIFPTSDSSFVLRVVEASVTFHRKADGAVEALTLHQNGNNKAHRVPEEAESVTLDDYVGRYFSEELETFYNLAVSDSALVIQHRRMPDITLTHAKGDSFTGDGAVATVDFERSEEGDVTGLKAGNGRTRGVQFVRQQP